ncbi:hypothetical protein [Thalassotalea agarivorans]|uniref:Uncharacterized protein n=1 Tax=Thalassotalea agarivorans TaxID=349064 RepID=A0A1I0A1H3_THASX|nr:hypothetical protein [Thalassotalea agarivorans]SES87007.1 hypothetical protein SAMN05660429_00637 [Thalassotalea agarivorans]
MSPEVIFFSVIIAVVVAFVGYKLLAHLKGKITLHLNKTSFRFGETLTGHFDLEAKKAIEGNELSVTLVAREKIEKRDSEGKRRTRTHEVYRNEKRLEGAKVYQAGSKANFIFEFFLPKTGTSEFAASTLGQAMNMLGSLLTSERRTIEWHIEARLDAKGIDITDSQRIYVE